MTHDLNQDEQGHLLKIARQALESGVKSMPLPDLELDELPPALVEQGASFVTLTIDGYLRGCVGALDAYQPLARDVQEHAVDAALRDFRFSHVTPAELPLITIEISILTPHVPLPYRSPQELIEKLRPHIDGVFLRDGSNKATFLPQVWDQLPNVEDFLSRLCLKMGAPGDIWRHKPLDVFIYQVQEFKE